MLIETSDRQAVTVYTKDTADFPGISRDMFEIALLAARLMYARGATITQILGVVAIGVEFSDSELIGDAMLSSGMDADKQFLAITLGATIRRLIDLGQVDGKMVHRRFNEELGRIKTAIA